MHEDDVRQGSTILSRVSDELVRSRKEFWGKGPVGAKSYMFDDMLFVVMHGGLTTAEETMLDFGQADLVRQYRQTFENEMAKRVSDAVGLIAGREVIGFQSQILFNPDRVIAMFIFDRPVDIAPQAATDEGQVILGETGEATALADLEEASQPPGDDEEPGPG